VDIQRRRRSAQVEVPKNELFIAKLNKATEDADLELIFSRFGRIESCDIVRDWKTGDSLNLCGNQRVRQAHPTILH
jgi:RNA recognition motif-containing protein